MPGWGRAPEVGNGNPLQYSLENSRDRGVWQGHNPWSCKRAGPDWAQHRSNEWVLLGEEECFL